MNLLPLAKFYIKHSEQLEKIAASGSGDGSAFALDLAEAVLPVLKKHRPAWNAEGLLDDAVAALRETL